jgi:hypothetical protein
MAEPAPKTGDGQTATGNPGQAPSDTLPAAEADGGKETKETEDKPTVDEPTAQSSAAAAEADTVSKAKDGQEPPASVEKAREGDSLSIGPSELPPPAIAEGTPDSPVCAITLLLPTGARHPYRIDEKYLAKRNVDVPGVTESGGRDPFSVSVYKLKELILREWREEWEGKPASPSSIRLIHFGKLLDDKEQLKSQLFFSVDDVTETDPAQSTSLVKTARTLSTCRCGRPR